MKYTLLALTLITATSCATLSFEMNAVTPLEVAQVETALHSMIGSSLVQMPELRKSGQVLQLVYRFDDTTLQRVIDNEAATLELRALSTALGESLERPVSVLLCSSHCAAFPSQSGVQ